jgi:peptide/nickel transport system ATP-binding protein
VIAMTSQTTPILPPETHLAVRDLNIVFPSRRGPVSVVTSASLTVRRGEITALVGESGSGKTMTSMAILGLVPALGGRVTGGQIFYDGRDIAGLAESEWRLLRGRRIAMIFQQPTRSLDPAFTVGDQIAEGIRAHQKVTRREAWKRAVLMLERVQIPKAAQRVRDYPHTFSGGMCQRVMIAMALACEPDLLIADEPTTALDVTVQATILNLIRQIQVETGISVLYITHDLAVVAQLCDRVEVMYAGETVESGEINAIFRHPRHPYTSGLLQAIPRSGRGDKRLAAIPGQVPPAHVLISGCRFRARCDFAAGVCAVNAPDLRAISDSHESRCLLTETITLEGRA